MQQIDGDGRFQDTVEYLYNQVKWPPNLASFDAAFCLLLTHARQRPYSGIPGGLAGPNLVHGLRGRFGILMLSLHCPVTASSTCPFAYSCTLEFDESHLLTRNRTETRYLLSKTSSVMAGKRAFCVYWTKDASYGLLSQYLSPCVQGTMTELMQDQDILVSLSRCSLTLLLKKTEQPSNERLAVAEISKMVGI